MWAIFRRQLAKNWLMILGWGLGLGFLGGYILDIYESFFEKNVNLNQFMEAFPKDILAFFGSPGDLFSVEGFLGIEFFSYLPVILGIVAITSAGKLIARQEENGTLELVLAQPISRSAVFWSKFLALIASIALILLLTWSGFAIGLARATTIDLTYAEVFRPIISLFSVVLVFLSLSLMLSMILPSSNGAGLIAGFLLIASYFITSLSHINPDLETINRVSPLKYYQGGEAMSGLDYEASLILFGLSVICIGIAWFFFDRRDLRLGGSGGLRLVVKRDKKE